MENVYIDLRTQNKWITEKFPNKDFVSIEDLLSELESLLDDIENLKDKIRDLENDIEDNYKPIPVSQQVF